MLFFACSQIFRRYVHDTVGINIKGNLDLRNAAHCRRNTIQSELAQRFVVLRKLSLALQYIDIHRRLIIGIGGEDLTVLGRDRRISLDQSGGNTAGCFDRK